VKAHSFGYETNVKRYEIIIIIIIIIIIKVKWEPGYLSGTELGYGWMIGGSSPGKVWGFFFSPPCLDRLWGPPTLLSKGYQGFFPWG
jgi:hypothetical protein